jgi:hypothetical protein
MRVKWPIALALASLLPGCPLALMDDYEITSERAKVDAGGAAGSVAAGGNAGSQDAAGGAGGSGTGGTTATSDAGGGAGSGGTEPVDAGCDATNCANTCCGGECVDTTSDARHCGGCNSPCPALRSCAFGGCSAGWLTVGAAPSTFAPREQAAYVWAGDRVFIWGGVDEGGRELDSGALYDPLTDQWTLVAKDGRTPSPRALATAVWTGSVVVVWGGGDAAGTTAYADGARYDPATNAWTDMASGATARRAPVGVWTGTRALFWGGWDNTGLPIAGAAYYDPALNAWTPATTAGDPGAVLHAAWAWSGTHLYTYGGQPGGTGRFDKAFRLDPAADAWSALPNGPTARYGAFGNWDGAAFVAVNGRDGSTPKDDGKYFAGTTWTGIEKGGMPTNRFAPHRRSGWSAAVRDGVSLFVGGMAVTSTSFAHNGGEFDRTLNHWTTVPTWPSDQDHEWGVGVWTGAELVVWGGRNGAVLSGVGERYLP